MKRFSPIALAVIGLGLLGYGAIADDSSSTPLAPAARPDPSSSSTESSKAQTALEQRINFLEIYCMRLLTREVMRSAPFDAQHQQMLVDYAQEMSNFVASRRGSLREDVDALRAALDGTPVKEGVKVVNGTLVIELLMKINKTVTDLGTKG